jgi:hypothetical protein
MLRGSGGAVKRVWFAGAVVASAALLSGTAALACGDKLLAPGSVARFRLIFASRQMIVLIYSDGNQSSSGSQVGAPLRNAKLQTSLKDAGLKLQTAEGPTQLDAALKSGKVDLVLADLTDLAGVTRQLHDAPSQPVVLPVLFKPSKAELSAAQKDYKFALKTPSDELQVLNKIDEAMQSRAKTHGKS